MTTNKGEESLDDLPELDPIQDAVLEDASQPQSPTDENLEDLPELEILGEAEPAESPEAQPEAQEIESLPELEVVGEALASEPKAESEELQDSGAAGGAEEEAEPEASSLQETANWRQTYELDFRGLTRDVRIERAHTATGDTLCALCFDPQGGVIEAVLQNSEVGLKHARLIADHHRDPFGLEALGRRAEFLRDSAVRRLLLRNLQATDSLLKKMLSPLSMQQAFRLSLGHESSERGRRVSREVFRAKFAQGSAEERVGLIVRSEGRCLTQLAGLTLDQKTTALLCGRTYQSTLLVQNLGRFSATPPNLIGALLKQPLVQRSQQLKRLLLQHKNCPSTLKK